MGTCCILYTNLSCDRLQLLLLIEQARLLDKTPLNCSPSTIPEVKFHDIIDTGGTALTKVNSIVTVSPNIPIILLLVIRCNTGAAMEKKRQEKKLLNQ